MAGRTQTRGQFARMQRKTEGDARNLVWQAKTTREQMESLAGRRGDSTRQMTKLANALVSERN